MRTPTKAAISNAEQVIAQISLDQVGIQYLNYKSAGDASQDHNGTQPQQISKAGRHPVFDSGCEDVCPSWVLSTCARPFRAWRR